MHSLTHRNTFRSTYLLAAAGVAVALLTGAAGAQDTRSIDLSRPVPTDTAVTTGVLPNGLRYYVRRNAKPEKRAELRLVVNAGSVLEDDDQRGLAHFLEHMAFNGTRHFRKNEIVKYLESVGMRFGADLNAYTSYDETVYMLTIPTDTPRVVSTALQILEDWAGAVTIDPKEVVAERGVVLEEWRGRLGAGSRVRDQFDTVIFRGSPYAARMPIGIRERIETARREELLRFYNDWYRPDLMAVIAVGDVDEAAMEAEIRKRFGKLRAPKRPRARAEFVLPTNTEPLVGIATDKELRLSSVEVMYKLPPRAETGTVAAYRRGLVNRLFSSMLNQRLSEIARQADAPFLAAQVETGSLVRTAPVFSVSVTAKENAIESGLAAVLREVERVVQHCFTPAELERVKVSLLRGAESRVAAREAIRSAAHVDAYISNFLRGSAIPGVDHDLALARELLPGITLEEVSAPARTWRNEENRIILATLPAKDGLRVPTREGLLAVFDSVAGTQLKTYAEQVGDTPLVPNPPAPGRVVRERSFPAVDVREWTLSNGARVLLKPTPFNADQVMVRASSKGGVSLAPDSLVRDASLATSILALGGLGDMPLDALRKRLAGTVVRMGASIGGESEGITASGSPRDLELLFTLMHLQFTAPRLDTVAFKAYKTSLREQLANRASDPAALFQDTLVATLTQGHPRTRPMTLAAVDSIDADWALRFFRDRFADASDFTFFIVGAFNPDSIRPAVERYIGGLPSIGRKETPRDVGIRPPRGIVRKTVAAGTEPRSSTRLVFTGEAPITLESRSRLDALVQVLQRRLTERLREQLGGTYSPGVSAGVSRVPVPRYEVYVSFGSAPERVDDLVASTLDIIRDLREKGPTAKEVHDAAEAQRRQRETALRENGYWLNMLVLHDDEGWDFASIAQPEPPGGGRALSAAAIQDAARRYLGASNYVQVTLVPATTTP